MTKKFAIVLALFVIAVVCCAGCIGPGEEPVDPVDPVVPVDPVDPVTPVDPVVPVEEYSVMFMLNYGDAGAYTAETVKAGETVSKPATPTRSGYTFKGWFTAAEGGAEYDFTQAVTADVTLYAQWSKKSSGSSGGHSHSYSWNVVKAANCTVDGQGQYVCSCGQVKATEAIPATGHLETEEVVNAASETEVKCKACGLVLVTIPASNTLEIYTLEELKAFAETVNAGTDYVGKTVELKDNIVFSGEDWTPIGQGDKKFRGTFEGNGHIITGLKVDQTLSDNAAGFFGVLNGNVQNLKFINANVAGISGVGVVAGEIFNTGSISNVEVTIAEVSGNHYVGGIVGYMYGSVSSCTVEDITVTAIPNAVSGGYDNGDKVGGIVGYAAEGSPVADCSATDVTLNAFRDVGGITGAAKGSVVTGNSVDGATITVDQITYSYGENDVNAAGVVGRLLESTTLDTSNTENDVTYHIKYTAKTTANLDKVLKLNAKTIEVTLNNDVSLTANDAYLKLGGDDTESITINGNENRLTLSTTYWSRLNTTSPDAKIIIKNAKLNSSQTSGTWNSYDITFMCNVELEDVILEKALALDIGTGTAKLTRVLISETHDYYALWICAGGATVILEDVTIDSTGRGIKIDDEYVNTPQKVTLTVIDSQFTTAKKAALMTKTSAGADIIFSGVNDISGVAADSINEVWVDEDDVAHYDLVTVTGGTKILEGGLTGGISVITTADGKTTLTTSTETGGTTVSDLASALEMAGPDYTIVLGSDVSGEAAITAPYGNKYGVKLDGGVLDGNGNELSIECYGDDYGIMTSAGTIKNLVIKEGCRAVMIMYPTDDVILDNVKLGGDGVLYPINTGESGSKPVNLTVTNSVIAGWTSYGNGVISSASFTNVTFEQGTYYNNIYGRVLKPYANTVLTDCSFIEHMNLDLSELVIGNKVTFKNCTVNGLAVTADVFTVPTTGADYDTKLFTVDLPSWTTSIGDCIIFK